MKNLAPQGLNGGTFDVVAYGADSSGSGDSTAAVNAAITAANTWAGSAGKRAVVHFPAGSYLIQGRVTVKANIVIWAHGAYIYGGTDYNSAGGAGSIMFNTVTGTGYAGGVDNVTVIGGIWDAKGQNAATDGVRDIFCVNNCRSWTFENCTFRNVPSWHAIDANSVDGLIVNNCRFEGFVDTTTGGTRADSEMVQLDTGGDGTPCKNIIVSGCSAGPATDGSGLATVGKLVGSHTPTVGNTGFHTDIRISDNYVNGSAGCSIQGYDWYNVTITGNTLLDSAGDATIKMYGQVSGTTEQIVINGNVIDGFATRGIYFSDQGSTGVGFTGCVIRSNTIIGSGTNAGIDVNFFSQGVVDGNQVTHTGTGTSGHGIVGHTCTDTTVTNNNLRGHGINATAGGAGVQWRNSTRCKVSGNKVYGVARHGFWFSDGGTDVICTDNYVDAAGRETGTYHGINLGGTSITEPTCRGNVIRPAASGNQVSTGITVASGSTGIVCYGNDVATLGVGDTGTNRGTEGGIAIPFHLTGSASTGVKLPEFIAPTAMRVVKAYARANSGSGTALRPSKNGGTGDGTILSSIGTTAVTNAQGVDLAAGDRLGVNVTTAGTGSDISATFWAILR